MTKRPLRTWFIRHQQLLLILILGTAASLRVAALLGLRASIYREYLSTDERGYHDWAQKLSAGTPHYVCHISALPAYYMAAIYRLFGADSVYVRWANLALGVATCWLLFGIGRRLGGTVVGLLASLFAAVYRPFVFLSITVLKEPLVLIAFAWMIFTLLGELKRHHDRVFCLGLSASMLLVLRPNAGVILVITAIIVIWLAWARTRSKRSVAVTLAALVSGALIPAGPFMLKNYQVAGQLSPAPQAGVELYLGNGEVATRPYYVPAHFATPTPEEQGVHFRIEASRRLGRVLTFAEASSYWAHEVTRHAWQAPCSFARQLLRKFVAAFHEREDNDNYSTEFLASIIPVLRVPLLSYWLVMPLGMAGLVVGWRRHRGALPLLLVAIAYELTLVLFYCNLRLRVPLLIILVPFASAGVLGFLRSAKRRSWRRSGFAALTLVFGCLEHLPLVGAGDLTAAHNTHAALLLENGDEAGALAYWQKSRALGGAFSDFASLSLARFALNRGDSHTARLMAATLADASFAAAFKYDLLGDAMRQDNRLQEAIEAYEEALRINSGRRDTREKLISIYRSLDVEKATQQERIQAHVESFFPPG